MTPEEYIETIEDEDLKHTVESIVNDYSMLDVLKDYYEKIKHLLPQ